MDDTQHTRRALHAALPRAAIALALSGALFAAAWELALMVKWAHRGQSDFAMLHRAGVELLQGPREGFYSRGDPENNWTRSIGPCGMMPFMALAAMPALWAGALWAAGNVLALAVCAVCLRGVYRRLECGRQAYEGTFWWAMVVLLALSCGSLQTGQFSVLFVACWLTGLRLAAARRDWPAGAMLALPTVVKFYPAILLVGPLLTRRWRQAAGLLLTAAALLGLTFPVYGPDAWGLWDGYVRQGLLGSSYNAVTHRLNPAVASNQGLDVVMMRLLCDGPVAASERAVLIAAQAIRLAVLAVTVVAAWRWCRRNRRRQTYALLRMLALWSATMVLALPEIKARYAVYAFPAILPLLAGISDAWRRGRTVRWAILSGALAACAAALGALPWALRPWGLGLAGAALLWALNLWLPAQSPEVSETPASEPQASASNC